MKRETENTLAIAFILSACVGCTALFISQKSKYARIVPQEVSTETAYCTFNEGSRAFKIIDSRSGKILVERQMPKSLFNGTVSLSTRDGPVYASGTRYIVRPESATCFIGDSYGDRKLIYKLVKEPSGP